jgi:hypothetical protein
MPIDLRRCAEVKPIDLRRCTEVKPGSPVPRGVVPMLP